MESPNDPEPASDRLLTPLGGIVLGLMLSMAVWLPIVSALT
jgi:hypothetical protein